MQFLLKIYYIYLPRYYLWGLLLQGCWTRMLGACWRFYSCGRPSRSLGTGLGSKCGKGSSALVGWTSARGCSFQWPAFKLFITIGIEILSTDIQVRLKVLGVSSDPGRVLFLSLVGLLYPVRQCLDNRVAVSCTPVSPGDNPVYSEFAYSWEQCLAMCFLASAICALSTAFCALYLSLLHVINLCFLPLILSMLYC